jgi:hypothetical protein
MHQDDTILTSMRKMKPVMSSHIFVTTLSSASSALKGIASKLYPAEQVLVPVISLLTKTVSETVVGSGIRC